MTEKKDTEKSTPRYVDYKNTAYLKRFMNPHGRMVAARRSGIPARHQRAIENAIKQARTMALLPFVIK